MPVKEIFGSSIELLGKTLDLRAKRQGLLASNIANAETPGYRPSDLSFEGELQNALKQGKKGAMAVEITNPRHIPLKGQSQKLDRVQGEVVETPSRAMGPDGNGVELEQEMGRLAENQIMYNAAVQLLNKKFEGMRLAIKGN